MKFIIACFAILALAAALPIQDLQEAETKSSVRYFTVGAKSSKYTFNQAQQMCKDKGGDLASIHSAADQTKVCGMCKDTGSNGCYIGFAQVGSTEGVEGYAWTDGTPVNYKFETDRLVSTAEDVVAMWVPHNCKWHDWGTRGSAHHGVAICGKVETIAPTTSPTFSPTAPTCPPAYTFIVGDEPNWGHTIAGGSLQNIGSSVECADECDNREKCLSYEFYITRKVCNLNIVAKPSVPRAHEDSIYCSKKPVAVVVPEEKEIFHKVEGLDCSEIKIPEVVDCDAAHWECVMETFNMRACSAAKRTCVDAYANLKKLHDEKKIQCTGGNNVPVCGCPVCPHGYGEELLQLEDGCSCQACKIEIPTEIPTMTPTEVPTAPPSSTPTEMPTTLPPTTDQPSAAPSRTPTEVPTAPPSSTPTDMPTWHPTVDPTEMPTDMPTELPTDMPTELPTRRPTVDPTEMPTEFPTHMPTEEPTELPTYRPTVDPTEPPTSVPTRTPTEYPTTLPPTTDKPSFAPSHSPTELPTRPPTRTPTNVPTRTPSRTPTRTPSRTPTRSPTRTPTGTPTRAPTRVPVNRGPWVKLLSNGNYGNYDVGASKFNDVFKKSGDFVIKRICSNCRSDYRETYYRRYTAPTSFAPYDYMKMNWFSRNNVINQDFGIFSSYADAMAKHNPWKYCNYNDPGVGFPRDCGKTGYVAHQWNAFAGSRHAGGSRHVTYYIHSVHPVHPPAPPTPAAKKAFAKGWGKADMLCDDTAGRHWYYLATSNGRFGANRHYASGWCSHSGSKTNWADINGDGKADMLCDDTAGRHWYRLSTGNGNFGGSVHYLSGWCGHGGSYTQWADINGDGKADLLCDDTAGRHWVKLSAGNGKFTNGRHYMSSWCGHSGSRTNWADVNGDGKADILCDDTAGRHWWRASAGGEGHFHGSHHYLNGWCGHSAGSKTNWADINGDGKADLLCDDSAGRHWYKLGAFGASRHYLSGWCGHSGSYTQWADINGDGKSDLLCDDTAGRHWFKLATGNGNFGGSVHWKSGWCSHSGSRTSWADITGN